MGPLTEKFGVGLEAQGSYLARAAEPSERLRMSARSRSIRRPARSRSTAISWSTISGSVLNPMIVRGQMHGGVAQGIGQALMEHAGLRPRLGAAADRQLHGLRACRAPTMLPNIETQLEEVPCKTNPLGVKGIGESGTIGAPPAVINAILDALKPLGVEQIDMPATPGGSGTRSAARRARRRRRAP